MLPTAVRRLADELVIIEPVGCVGQSKALSDPDERPIRITFRPFPTTVPCSLHMAELRRSLCEARFVSTEDDLAT